MIVQTTRIRNVPEVTANSPFLVIPAIGNPTAEPRSQGRGRKTALP
jgi:hypothetical protein